MSIFRSSQREVSEHVVQHEKSHKITLFPHPSVAISTKVIKNGTEISLPAVSLLFPESPFLRPEPISAGWVGPGPNNPNGAVKTGFRF